MLGMKRANKKSQNLVRGRGTMDIVAEKFKIIAGIIHVISIVKYITQYPSSSLENCYIF